MNIVNLLFWVFLSAGLLATCDSSSSKKNGGSSDGGAGSDSALAGDAAELCNVFDDVLGTSGCAREQMCCFMGSSATCQDPSACNSGVHFECRSSNDCNADEVCCGTFWPLPGVDDASVSGASSLDASLRLPDGGAEAGQKQLIMDFIAKTFCANSCSSPDHLICRNNADCEGGATCGSMPEGSNSAILAAAAESFFVCISTE